MCVFSYFVDYIDTLCIKKNKWRKILFIILQQLRLKVGTDDCIGVILLVRYLFNRIESIENILVS